MSAKAEGKFRVPGNRSEGPQSGVPFSQTEVTHLRDPGQLVFTTDNEIMSVPVAAGVRIVPGDIVDFDDDGFAKVADPTTFDRTNGYGVCIHEGYDNRDGHGPNTDGAGLVQIATGNAYVVCTAATTGIVAFRQLRLASGGTSILRGVNGIAIPAGNRLADGRGELSDLTSTDNDPTAIGGINGAINRLNRLSNRTVGRSYGLPGDMVRPQPSTAGAPIVVRLGLD